jgi:hypothetical protein
VLDSSAQADRQPFAIPTIPVDEGRIILLGYSDRFQNNIMVRRETAHRISRGGISG